jgi:hypothetical protein
MSIIEEERVLCVVFNLALVLRLPSHIIEVAGLEVVIVLSLIIRNVATNWSRY